MPYETRLRKVSETDVNSANNTSKVTIAFDFRRTDYTYTGYNMEGNAYYTITCAGQSSGKVYFTFDWTVAQNEWKEIGRKTFTVTHNADGSKTAAISGYWYTGIAPAELSASDSITLTTIPRATTPTLSASSVAAGGSVTINTPRASSSFTHTLTYSFGTKSGTIASSVGTSYAWTVPLSILTGIPNTTSGTCTITCKTYNGSTLIGTKTVTLKITAPSSVVPTISSVAIAEAVTSVKTKFGAYVQNKSKLTVKTTAAGAQGSTISSCKVTVNGVTYTGTNITTGVITISGSVSVKATVTDSRGRTATKTETITVLEYFNPTILAFSGVRCTDTGEEDDEGTGLKLMVNYKVAEVDSKNTPSFKVQMKKEGEAWSDATDVLSGESYTYNNAYLVSGTALSADYSYTLRLTVTDFFTSAVMDIQVGTAFTLVDSHSSGKGMALGKVAEKEGYVEVNLIAEFLKNVLIHSGDTEYNVAEELAKIDPLITTVNTKQNSLHMAATTETDFDNIKTTGYYWINPNTTTVNHPYSGRYGVLEVLRNGVMQRFTAYNNATASANGKVYVRFYVNSAWTAWSEQGKAYLHKAATDKTVSVSSGSISSAYGTYTPVRSGVALISVKAFFAKSTSSARKVIIVRLNDDATAGNELCQYEVTGTSSTMVNGTFMVQLAAGDKVTAHLYQNSGSTMSVTKCNLHVNML